MVVQVVAEHVYEIDGVVSGVARRVPRKQHKSYITDVVVDFRVGVLQLSRGFPVAEQHRWRRVRRPQPFLQLLHEHLPYHDVVFVAETRRKNDRDSIGFRLDVHRLVISVMDDGSFLALVAVFLEIEVLFEDRRETVAFQQADLFHDFRPVLRDVFQVKQDRDVVAVLGFDEQGAVLAFEELVGSVLLQLFVKLQ